VKCHVFGKGLTIFGTKFPIATVGLLKGSPGNMLPGFSPNHFAIVNLGLVEGNTPNDPRRGRLTNWFNTGNPLKMGDAGSATPPTFA
jgi:hypothetical protein